MLSEKVLTGMRLELVGKKIHYCFHLYTPRGSRREFTILEVKPEKGGWFNLVGSERMLESNSVFVIAFMKEGDKWVREGMVYMWKGEEPHIDGKPWGQWFTTGATVRIPRGI